MSIVDSLLKEPTMPHDGGKPASSRLPSPELAVPSSVPFSQNCRVDTLYLAFLSSFRIRMFVENAFVRFSMK